MSDAQDTITFEEAKRLMDTEKDCVLLDVREEPEYITGHAEGAVLLPVDTIDSVTAGEVIPSMDTVVLVYCRSGARSRLAARTLAELGYSRVYNIGSLVGWPYGIAW